jgi:tetraacyldisaccharide 4'-kinase
MSLTKYFPAPLGYMREGFQGLKDADLIVIGKADIAGPEKVNSLKNILAPYLPINVGFAVVGYLPNGFYNAANDLVLTPEKIKGRKVIGIAGIANPQSFFKLLESLGAEVIVTESFPDHHYFTLDEINALLAYAKSEDALLVTTEKDMVRIKKIIEDDSIVFLEVEVNFISGEEETMKIIDSCFQNIY